MAATCAVCMQPIVDRADFLIHRTEVVHKRCVRVLHDTHASRQAREIAQLEAELRGVHEDTRRLDNQRIDEIARLEKETHRLREELRRAERRAIQAESTTGVTDAAARRDRDDALRQLDTAIRERDAARREAQLHQTIQGSPTRTPEVATTPAKTDSRGDAEVRFSLLELDPLE